MHFIYPLYSSTSCLYIVTLSRATSPICGGFYCRLVTITFDRCTSNMSSMLSTKKKKDHVYQKTNDTSKHISTHCYTSSNPNPSSPIIIKYVPTLGRHEYKTNDRKCSSNYVHSLKITHDSWINYICLSRKPNQNRSSQTTSPHSSLRKFDLAYLLDKTLGERAEKSRNEHQDNMLESKSSSQSNDLRQILITGLNCLTDRWFAVIQNLVKSIYSTKISITKKIYGG